MSIQLKKDTPRTIRYFLKEMISVCGNKSSFNKLFFSSSITQFLKSYPIRKTTIENRNTQTQEDSTNEYALCYLEFISYIESVDIWQFQTPSQFRQQNNLFDFRPICHINFTNLQSISLDQYTILNIESLAFLNAPQLQKIKVQSFCCAFTIKAIAKTNFKFLKSVRFDSLQGFNLDEIKLLNRTHFLVDQSKNSYEKDPLQLSSFLKKRPHRIHLTSLCVKIPFGRIQNSLLEPRLNVKCQNSLINLNMQSWQLSW